MRTKGVALGWLTVLAAVLLLAAWAGLACGDNGNKDDNAPAGTPGTPTAEQEVENAARLVFRGIWLGNPQSVLALMSDSLLGQADVDDVNNLAGCIPGTASVELKELDVHRDNVRADVDVTYTIIEAGENREEKDTWHFVEQSLDKWLLDELPACPYPSSG